MEYIQLAYVHLASVLPAFAIGTYLLLSKKGTSAHKVLGKVYMLLMMFTACITLFMTAEVGPRVINHFGFIHILSFLVLYTVPTAFLAARNGNIKQHKYSMISLYIGGIIIAGSFAFMPGRLLHIWLFS